MRATPGRAEARRKLKLALHGVPGDGGGGEGLSRYWAAAAEVFQVR
jgi:hypothetical protein